MSAKAEIELRTAGSGQLQCRNADGVFVDVRVQPSFPLSNPGRFLALLDDERNEAAMVEEVGGLSPDSREALEGALADAGFLMEITRIEEIETETDLRNWKVMTKQGARTFQTRLGNWPRRLLNGGVLISDVGEDVYLIPDPDALDARSQKMLWAYSG